MWRSLLISACAFLAAEAEFNVKDPELGQFQDDGKCFPLKKTWFVVYRSYDSDPFFGLTAKCLRVHSTDVPYVNNATRVRVEFGDHGILDLNAKLLASEGYKHQNRLRVSPVEGPELEIDLRVDYVECNTCKILIHPYISKTACSLLVPEPHVANPHSACHFIYRMLCGSKKVQIYDASCKKHH
uniref:Putative lipocal-1 1 n=1 Tax=Amblyomma triste TaxID=251400 RepID=A0A023GCV9_AMBTT